MSSSLSASAPGRGSMPAMHWCHECGIEIRPLMTPGPTCPRCNGEFVEEIDPANPITIEDDEDDDQQMQELPRPFAGAAGGPINQDQGTFAQPGMDLGTVVGSILRNLASAGSQPRPTEYTQPERNRSESNRGNGDSNIRTGTTQAGPISFTWGTSSFQTTTTTTNASGSTRTSTRSQTDSPFGNGAAPLGLNDFLRQSFEHNGHHHDDGMGGAGGAADGRFFNADNRGANSSNREGRLDEIDEDEDEEERNNNAYPPEIASIRDVFANLFGGMGDGPAGMLIDMFGGGTGSGRSGDYVWGQRGLDDVITQLMEQTRGSTAPPPASEEAIKRLERFSRKDISKVRLARNRECSTCMDSFEDEEEGQSNEPAPSMDSNRLSSTYKDANEEIDDDDPPDFLPTEEQQDELMMMPCKHLFHLDCLLPWLKTNGTCPVCRVSLDTDKDKEKGKNSSSQGTSNQRGESSGSTPGTAIVVDDDSVDDSIDDESPEEIRQRTRRAAEARLAGSSSEQRQTIPGGYLQPDDLD